MLMAIFAFSSRERGVSRVLASSATAVVFWGLVYVSGHLPYVYRNTIANYVA